MKKQPEIDKQLFDDLLSSFIEAKTQSSIDQLRIAEIVKQAEEKLNKKRWREWIRHPKINLKRTQAQKLVSVSIFCKKNSQSTDIFKNHGIEKTYIIAQIEDIEVQSTVLEYVLTNPISTKLLKKAIKLMDSEHISFSEAIEKAKIPKQTQKKNSELEELKQAFLKLQETNKNLEKQLIEERQKNSEKPQKQTVLTEAENTENQTSIFEAL